jgi:NAD(P)-dependent dehydrogenase (short-subunit alcohol dehydrogenase family)
LAARGWLVFATMRNLTRKDSLERALKNAGLQDRVTIEQLDISDPTSIHAAVASILSQTDNKLDAVVHNAGVAVAGVLEDLPESEIRRVMETNFFGVLELTRALLPTLRAQRAGRILIVSSEAAFMGQPANSIYCASKWAIEGWAEAICHELAPFGIEVVLVEPGPYVTGIWKNSPRISPEGSAYRQWVQYAFRAGEAHLAKRGGDARRVATAIADILEASKPGFRNPVGRVARVAHFLRGKVPSAVLRKGVSRYLGLDRFRP